MGDSITEGTIVEFARTVGDFCNVDDIVAVIETDKVSVDIRAEQAGVITELLAAVDDTVEVGAPLFSMDTSAEAPSGSAAEPTPADAPAPEAASQPAAAPASQSSTPPPPPPPPKPAAAAAPATSAVSVPGLREERRVPMSRMRQRIAQRLKDSQNTAASLTTFNEIDMSNLFALRNKHKDEFLEKHGVKLGFMSAFVKASCAALQAQPAVNAYMEEKEFVYHDYCDVSVAVASPSGLVVPVIRNAESMSFMEVEKAIGVFAKKAKDGSLTLEEMSGGTFTISNGGVFGSLMGTPILNPPQSAILGMHGVFERPVAIKGQVEIRPMMYVALTYDHRIIDGREAVLFLRTIKNCIEDPQRLLLDL